MSSGQLITSGQLYGPGDKLIKLENVQEIATQFTLNLPGCPGQTGTEAWEEDGCQHHGWSQLCQRILSCEADQMRMAPYKDGSGDTGELLSCKACTQTLSSTYLC